MVRCSLLARIFSLLFLFVVALPFPLKAAQGTIFVYHRFGEDAIPSTNIALATFAAQLAYLAENNIPVLPLGEVVKSHQTGQGLPERYVVLTVDDGYTSFLHGAMPLLRKHGMPVTLFVSTASVGARGYLDWEQLRSLRQEGVEIGNHSHTHPHLVNLREKQGGAGVRAEIRRSQQLFRQNLGAAPRLFAYPFGETTPEITQLVAEEGFVAATVQHSGVVAEQSDLLQLPRFAMGGPYATLQGFIEKSKLHALPVVEASAPSPLFGKQNPPQLTMRFTAGSSLQVDELNCYVAGQRACSVTADNENGQGFTVVADRPLTGRRNRYTLTARDPKGYWYWYTWLWIDPSAPE